MILDKKSSPKYKNKSYLNRKLDTHLEWRVILNNSDDKSIRMCPKARSLAFKGIPTFIKSRVYSNLLQKSVDINYEDLKSMECKYEHQIDVDIQRTFREHFMYKEKYGVGQSRLFHVLVAFANYMPKIGYCQGMSNIVALILMYFEEEEAFFILIEIIKRNNLETLFDKNLSMIKKVIEIQKTVLKECVSGIYEHFVVEEVDISVYVYSWYLTIFTRFHIELVWRIWDIFIFDGFAILFYVAAAIFRYFKRKILLLEGEKLLEFLGKIESYNIDPERLILKLNKLLRFSSIFFIEKEFGIKKY